MTARMLSRTTRRALHVATVGLTWLSAHCALAQEDSKTPATAILMANPFVTQSDQAATSSQQQPSTGNRLTFQNPFATAKNSAPRQAPPEGPLSRWKRQSLPEELTPVRSALLSKGPITRVHGEWDELSPGKAFPITGSTTLGRDASSALPPDPSSVAPVPLAQPAWLVTGTTANSPQPIGQTTFNQLERFGPLNATAEEPRPIASAGADATIISDYVDSADSLLAQAQQQSRTAETNDELSAIIDLCQRGLKAAPHVEDATALRRLAAWAHNRRGEALADTDQPQQAIDDFQAAIVLDPACSIAFHNRAVTLAERHEYSAALRDFNRVIELNPGLGIAYRNRAELFAATGKMSEAILDYDRAIESMSNDPRLFQARGYAFQCIGNLARAQVDLNRAIELSPNDPEILAQRGNLAAEQGAFQRALDDFQEALSINAGSKEANRSVAWLQATCPDEKFRDADRALDAARTAMELAEPDDYMTMDTLAAAHANAGQFEAAINLQQRAIAACPEPSISALRKRLALYQRNEPFRSPRVTVEH